MVNSVKAILTSRGCVCRLRVYGGALAWVLVLTHIAISSTYANDDPREADRETMRRVHEQLQELKAKVTELEARLNALGASTATPAADVGVPGSPSSGASPPATPTLAVPEPPEDKLTPAVTLRMFGDVGYVASDQKGKTNSFRISSLDLFMTGALTDRVSVLGEVLFIPVQDNSIDIDVERLLLQYKHNDFLNVGIGRYHPSIGYYNTAFHQGAWFQTAIDRPFMYAFDDQGGFLPLQEVGVTTYGQIPSGSLGLNYVAEIGNGRAHLLGSEPAQNLNDTNNGKSFNFALYARPNWLPGLQAGFSINHDHITFSDHDNHSELVSTVHVVYTNSNYEFLNEGMLVRHTGNDAALPRVFHTPGFYTQFSRRFGKYRPYVRYAYVNAGVAEPIYGDPADGPVVGRRNGPTFGLRYDLNDHAAFKLQYDHLSQRGQKSFNLLETQFSFAF
jgi:hypothetical protein